MLTNRNSASECAGSGIITSSASLKTVIASAKLMPCLDRFEAALSASHSNSTTQSYRRRWLKRPNGRVRSLCGAQPSKAGRGGRADQEPDLCSGARLPVEFLQNQAPAFGAVWKLWLVATVVCLLGHAWFYKLRKSFADLL